MKELKDLVTYICKALVDNQDKVVVTEIAGDKSVIYELRVGEGDLGKVIGKQGRTAQAVRTIITAAAMKLGKRTVLEILE
ncbi:RNA-binding protein [candidate division WOR_3 bacterium SM23_42]|uniref:RNA-binding protein KhpA n=1 Tax=candidate division WOR_3 bacterium SM23_42 TaxID=1703779 RepID=A0A0S8FPR5_UNCW3|nr:MAG: RNA-binding protein [candidate division WOR_3 bacterium SM23_42]